MSRNGNLSGKEKDGIKGNILTFLQGYARIGEKNVKPRQTGKPAGSNGINAVGDTEELGKGTDNMNDALILAEHVSVSFDGGTSWSLRDLSLSIGRGKKVAVMGPNGSGKTTFLSACQGLCPLTEGRLYLDGKPAAPLAEEGERSKKPAVRRIPSLEARELEQAAQECKQEAPLLLILDGPAAWDRPHRALVSQLSDQLTAQGTTVLFATYEEDFAMEWADEVLVFHRGQVLIQGTPEQVFANSSVLALTNLEKPASLRIFDCLCRKGILSSALPVPRTLDALEAAVDQLQDRPYRGGVAGNQGKKQAILAVSFGTSFREARISAIEAIENAFGDAFPGLPVYRAWTSGMIRRKLLRTEGMEIDGVTEAMGRMRRDGITDVLIQPTHIVNGIENEQMKADALAWQDQFHSISFGTPLLTSQEDCQKVIEAVAQEFAGLGREEALVLMGHGTTHYANSVYAALDYQFKDTGHPNIYLGTVEAYPSMESLLSMLRAAQPSQVVLAPFMIVAGDHARNDMAGEEEDSWKRRLEREGFSVSCVMKGLGEYPAIRRILVEHLREAQERAEAAEGKKA